MPARIPVGLGPRCVDTGNPVANHPLNVGLVAWWMPLANNWGTSTLFDLTKRNTIPLTGGPTWVGKGLPNNGPNVLYNGSSQYGTLSTAIVAEPFSVVCFFNPTSVAAQKSFLTLGTGVVARWQFDMNAGAVRAISVNSGGTVGTATASGTVSTGAWQQAAAVFTSATSRAAYYNGANKGTNTTSTAPSATQTDIATLVATPSFTRSQYFAGQIESLAVYSRALSDADVWSLNDQSLRGYPDTLRRFTPTVWSFGSVAAPTGRLSRPTPLDGLGGAGQQAFNPSLSGM